MLLFLLPGAGRFLLTVSSDSGLLLLLLVPLVLEQSLNFCSNCMILRPYSLSSLSCSLIFLPYSSNWNNRAS